MLVEKFGSKKPTVTDSEMEVDQDQVDIGTPSLGLMDIISRSSSQNLEANIVKRLDSNRACKDSDANEVNMLAESIFRFESQQDENVDTSVFNDDKVIIDNFKRTISQDSKWHLAQRQLSVGSYERCVVDVLLDLYCRRDRQIVQKKLHGVETEFRLLFEQRRRDGTYLTQSFLLALFIHQANWSNLFECIQYLLESRSIFSKLNNKYS